MKTTLKIVGTLIVAAGIVAGIASASSAKTLHDDGMRTGTSFIK